MDPIESNLSELYIAFFNRAPDASGLAYWANQLQSGGVTLSQIAENWMTSQGETTQKYPSSISNTDFINDIYRNILGREADLGGANYWQQQLENQSVSRDSFILSLINGAKANSSAQGLQDSALLANRAEAGVIFAHSGLNDLTLAKNLISAVDSTPQSLQNAQTLLGAAAEAIQSNEFLSSTLSNIFASISSLTSTHPERTQELSEYINSIAKSITQSTNITSLLSIIDTKISSAISDAHALDNPDVIGSSAALEATPRSQPIFSVKEIDGVITFANATTEKIEISISPDGIASFTNHDVTAATTISNISSKTIELASDQTLAVDTQDWQTLQNSTITGQGTLSLSSSNSLYFNFTNNANIFSIENIDLASGTEIITDLSSLSGKTISIHGTQNDGAQETIFATNFMLAQPQEKIDLSKITTDKNVITIIDQNIFPTGEISGTTGVNYYQIYNSTIDNLTKIDNFDNTKDSLSINSFISSFGSADENANANSTGALASSGNTTESLATDLATAVSNLIGSAGANAWSQYGDTMIVQITGSSLAGNDAYYVVQNRDGNNTFDAVNDNVIALVGTSTAPESLSNFNNGFMGPI